MSSFLKKLCTKRLPSYQTSVLFLKRVVREILFEYFTSSTPIFNNLKILSCMIVSSQNCSPVCMNV